MNGFYHEGLQRLILDLLRKKREWFYSQDYGHVFLRDALRAGVAQILIDTEDNYLLNAPEEVGVMCEMAWCAYEIAYETVDWNDISLSLQREGWEWGGKE